MKSIFGVLKDITPEKNFIIETEHRKKVLEELLERTKKSEQKYRERFHWYEFLLDACYETAISVTDMKKNVTFINNAGLKILGKRREEVLGKYCGDVWKADICRDSRCGIEQLRRCRGKACLRTAIRFIPLRRVILRIRAATA